MVIRGVISDSVGELRGLIIAKFDGNIIDTERIWDQSKSSQKKSSNRCKDAPAITGQKFSNVHVEHKTFSEVCKKDFELKINVKPLQYKWV